MHQHHALVVALVEDRQRDLRSWRRRPTRRRPSRWAAVAAATLLTTPLGAGLLAMLW